MFAATQPYKESHIAYTEPAAADDVMFEQLEYLLDHRTDACAPGCHDCDRLARVQEVLLLPFRDFPRAA